MSKNRNLRQGFGELVALVCVAFVAYAVLHGLHGSQGPASPKARKEKHAALRVAAPAPVKAQPQVSPVVRQKTVAAVGAPKQAVVPVAPALPVAGKPRVALVVDDWGYTSQNLALARQMKFPVTAAIIPRLSLSTKVSEELHTLGFEIIMHLPMEPNEHKNLEKNTIMTSWKPNKIETVMDQGFATVKHAKGINNHMGSKATADKQTMDTVIAYLRGKGMYFLDSFVISDSLGFVTARALGVPCARRDIFLDNSDEPAAIRSQLEKLKKKALQQGLAVGIGHDRAATLKVLLEEVPKLQAQGIEFVFLSQVVE